MGYALPSLTGLAVAVLGEDLKADVVRFSSEPAKGLTGRFHAWRVASSGWALDMPVLNSKRPIENKLNEDLRMKSPSAFGCSNA